MSGEAMFDLFVCVLALRPSQHFSVMSGRFPGSNRY